MSILDGLRHRAYVLLNPSRYEDERAEELTTHSEMARASAAVIASPSSHPRGFGVPPRDSLPPREALRALLDSLRQDFTHALRDVRRSPGFSAMVAVTLALGVGANAAVFTLLDRILGQPPVGLEDPASLRKLYRQYPVNLREPGMVLGSFDWVTFSALRRAAPTGARLVAWDRTMEDEFRLGSVTHPVSSAVVSDEFFETLGVDIAMGRSFDAGDADEDPSSGVALISQALWKSAFAEDPNVLGQTIEREGSRLTIIGVTAEGFSGLELGRTDLFLPIEPPTEVDEQRDFQVAVIARLDGLGEEGLTESATLVTRRTGEGVYPEDDSTVVVLAGSMIGGRGPGRPNATMQITTRLAGVAGIVFLIACSNVSGLFIVRGMRRRRETAVRLALGVSRIRLLRQFTIESAILASMAGGSAVFVASAGGSVLRKLLLPTIEWPRPPLDARTLVFTSVTAALAAIVVGIAPGFQLRGADLKADLGSSAREGRQRRPLLRSGLLAAQVGLSLVLLVGTGLFLRSLAVVAGIPVGYDKTDLGFIISDQSLAADDATLIAEGMRAAPGVSGVATASAAPMNGWAGIRVYLPDRDSVPRLRPDDPGPQYLDVAPNYFEATGLRLIAGRTFEPEEPRVIVVTENMAKLYWPGQNPLGQCIALGLRTGPCQEVVGVVEDARLAQILEKPRTIFFRALRAQAAKVVVFRVDDPRDWPAAASAATALVQERLDPTTSRVLSMSEALEPQLRSWKLGTQLFAAFSFVALLVTAVGTYSVMAYSVSQRTHEMGVRVALGARVLDVLRLVVGDGLRVVLLGALVGVALALALGKLIAALLYGVTPRDPVAMGAAVAVLLVTGVIASLIPAWRAARVDPVRALAAE